MVRLVPKLRNVGGETEALAGPDVLHEDEHLGRADAQGVGPALRGCSGARVSRSCEAVTAPRCGDAPGRALLLANGVWSFLRGAMS